MKIPWWFTVCIGLLVYALSSWLLPMLHSGNKTLDTLFARAPQLAPIIAIALLLLGAKQLYDLPSADEDRKQNKSEDDENLE